MISASHRSIKQDLYICGVCVRIEYRRCKTVMCRMLLLESTDGSVVESNSCLVKKNSGLRKEIENAVSGLVTPSDVLLLESTDGYVVESSGCLVKKNRNEPLQAIADIISRTTFGPMRMEKKQEEDIQAARAVVDVIRTTLGSMGMDKNRKEDKNRKDGQDVDVVVVSFDPTDPSGW